LSRRWVSRLSNAVRCCRHVQIREGKQFELAATAAPLHKLRLVAKRERHRKHRALPRFESSSVLETMPSKHFKFSLRQQKTEESEAESILKNHVASHKGSYTPLLTHRYGLAVHRQMHPRSFGAPLGLRWPSPESQATKLIPLKLPPYAAIISRTQQRPKRVTVAEYRVSGMRRSHSSERPSRSPRPCRPSSSSCSRPKVRRRSSSGVR
jgi:hypothetical protein